MTVKQLIDALDGYNPSAKVRIAFQPNHPIQAPIDSVISLRECDPDEDEDDGEDGDLDDVWIVSGDVNGYITGRLWNT
jgi:hypothetical protein